MIKKIIQFITTDIWRIKLDSLPKSRMRIIRQLQILLIAVRGFNDDKCMLRASALTFYTMLSFVPVVAMIFGISKGFGMDEMIRAKIMGIEGYNQDVLIKVAEFADQMLQNTKGGLIAGVGVVVLFWSVMKVLGNIEASFNDIWEIKNQRSLGRKFSDYLSIMLIAPIILIVSGSMTGYISQLVEYVFSVANFLEFMKPVISFVLRLLPYTLIWFLLTFIYLMMPNTRVKFKSALVAGVIAGTLFELAEIFYFYFQFGVAKYNAIYGSFAALPLFLIWLQTSWVIVLFGAEISFANQNVSRYEFEADAKGINYRYKKELSLFIMHHIVRRFIENEKPYSAGEMAVKFSIPIRLLRLLLNDLVNAGLLSELNSDDHQKEVEFQPGRDVAQLTTYEIIRSLEESGTDNIPIEGEDELKKLRDISASFIQDLKNSKHNIPISEI